MHGQFQNLPAQQHGGQAWEKDFILPGGQVDIPGADVPVAGNDAVDVGVVHLVAGCVRVWYSSSVFCGQGIVRTGPQAGPLIFVCGLEAICFYTG